MQNSGLQKDCVRDMNLFDLPLYSAEGHNGHLLPQAYRSHSPKGFPMMPKQTPNAVGYKVSGSYSFFFRVSYIDRILVAISRQEQEGKSLI